MAAGAGYIEFTTGDILTASAANEYLASQVVMVFASASARTSAIASPQEGMVSYLKDTNAVEYYSGSAWTGIGGASGGMTLLSTTTLSGSSTSISVTPTGYQQLFVKIYDVNCSSNNVMRMRFNSDTTATNYSSYWAGNVGYGTTSGYSVSGEYVTLGFPTTNGIKAGSTNNIWTATLCDPNSTTRKTVQVNGAFYNDSNYESNLFSTAAYLGGSAISSIEIVTTAGTFSGGTVKVYGVK